MILNVTEEQKKLIESQDYMVVEFKSWYRKLGSMLIDYVRRAIDTWKAIMLFLQEKIMKAFDVVRCSLEMICDKISPYIEQRDYVYVDYDKRKKYPFVRSLGRKYQPNFSYKVIYHRCRDRC